MGFSNIDSYIPAHEQDMVTDEGEADSKEEDCFTDVEFQRLPYWHQGRNTAGLSMLCRGIAVLLIVSLTLSNIYTWSRLRQLTPSDSIYSPATSAIRHKNVRFTAGIKDDMSPYQGPPSEENNRLWEDLYEFGVDRIPTSEAVKLSSPTSPIPNDPGGWVIILDVFHQLHCLNLIRKRLYWNESLPVPQALNMVHLDHCVDQLRQSLTCSSDLTPIPYAWYPQYDATFPTTGVTHTCRDFDAVRDWARERYSEAMDFNVHVPNPHGDVVHVFPSNDSS